MKINETFKAETVFFYVATVDNGVIRVVPEESNEVAVLVLGEGEVVPSDLKVGAKLIFKEDGTLKEFINPSYAAPRQTKRSGCMEQKVQG